MSDCMNDNLVQLSVTKTVEFTFSIILYKQYHGHLKGMSLLNVIWSAWHTALRSCRLLLSVCGFSSPAFKTISIAGTYNLATRVSAAPGRLAQLRSQRLLLDTWQLLTKSFATYKDIPPPTWQTKPPENLLCCHRFIHDFSCHQRYVDFFPSPG